MFLPYDSEHDPAKWMNCFKFNVSLGTYNYIGFTAMTGGVTSTHDIHYINAYSITVHIFLYSSLIQLYSLILKSQG